LTIPNDYSEFTHHVKKVCFNRRFISGSFAKTLRLKYISFFESPFTVHGSVISGV